MKSTAPAAECMRIRIEAQCRAKGIKLTGHQRLIVQLVSRARDYPDFAELYRRVGESNPRVSRATVSRTLTLLTREGIIERHEFRDGRLRYERIPERHHDHLIDLSTGKICEFNDAHIEHLQEKIARDLGYRLVAHRLELYATPVPRPPLHANVRKRRRKHEVVPGSEA